MDNGTTPREIQRGVWRVKMTPESLAESIQNGTVSASEMQSFVKHVVSSSERWNDSDININWGVANPYVSPKDSKLPLLKDQRILPKY